MDQGNNEMKRRIQESLKNLAKQEYFESILSFWNNLGYESERQPEKQHYSYAEFKDAFDEKDTLKDEKAKSEDWGTLHLLFQITDEELSTLYQLDLFSERQFKAHINSYIFAALDLKKDNYSRGALAEISRQINRCFMVPIIIAFRYGDKLTIAVVGRRVNRRHIDKDVLLKVTLIRDIELCSPHRAHIDILYDLSLDQLKGNHIINNFDDLHKAWEKTLDLNELNKRFYQELSNWYFWAIQEVEFPAGEERNRDIRNSTSIIRLITRMFFVWFMKEKKLVPEALFDRNEIDKIINYKDYNDSTYYKAILQNLFFATLNTEMEIDGEPARIFRARKENWKARKNQFMEHSYFRYEKYFNKPDEVIAKHFQEIPFLNGGLFECLDHDIIDHNGRTDVRIDGFSDRSDNILKVPDKLFLQDDEQMIDLNSIYGTKDKRYRVRGLLSILHSYKFTVAENTPIEEEVALDPELLGRVFENLLASYNPETRTTARKETGSFYTPRNIVDYMVDESLILHMQKALNKLNPKDCEDNKLKLQLLFAYADEDHLFTDEECDVLIDSIDNLKAIDPACGSGAFLMGLLLKMVYILHKLDPDNKKWKKQQVNRLNEQIKAAKSISDYQVREEVIKRLEDSKDDIENTFDHYDFDYSRKLFLIENCLYGVDIQPIALQIAKLRFFLSLLVDEQKKENVLNYGIRALPNMESKLIAADSLLHLNLKSYPEIFEHGLQEFRKEIKELQREYFTARTRSQKLALREKDVNIREKFADKLIKLEASPTIAEKIAKWDPYKTNVPADFMDLGVMFGIDNVNVVIANPPYIRQENIPNKRQIQDTGYEIFNSTSDIYTYFYEQAFNMLSTEGIATFITSNKWMKAKFGYKLRSFFGRRTKLVNIIDFSGYQVFGSATVDTNILVFQKSDPDLNHKLEYVNIDENYKGGDLAEFFYKHKSYINQRKLQDSGWTLAKDDVLSLKERIEKMGKPLKEWEVNIYYGIKTGYNPAFVIDTATKERLCADDPRSAEVIKPLLRGRDVGRYRHKWANLWIIVIPNGWTNSNKNSIEPETFFKSYFPAIHNHLKKMGDRQTKGKGLYTRDDQGDYWWELRACAYYEEFEKEKIVWQEIAQTNPFSYDDKKMYGLDTSRIMSGKHLKSLLGVFNSRFFKYAFSTFYAGGSLGAKGIRFKSEFMKEFPIPENLDLLKEIEFKVNEYLKYSSANNEDSNEIKILDEEIDELVYRLYNLSEEEIRIIES
ncbi:MAG: Eco57I restriction-modification methylase domain-containing protein [Candidatus Cloacimonetes bacterium]|nr:Eco57I restriction-modification methylase domain-containing protein [Candidatus Cloacimonadota bacterium]